MLRAGVLRSGVALFLLFSFGLGLVHVAHAQVSNKPTAACHVSDGQFTTCSSGKSEWSDVQPLFFLASNSYLYVNQDAAHSFLYLMYDFPFRTSPVAAGDSVRVSFDTVEQDADGASLEHYDISIFGNGVVQVLVNGSVEDAGRIVGAVGFHPSANSAIPHLMAELQVPLTPGVPTTYSPDPIFWSVTTPPTPPPPTPPPTCPPLAACNKSPEQISAWLQAAAEARAEALLILSEGREECNQPLEEAEAAAEQSKEVLSTLVGLASAAISRSDLPSKQALDLENALLELDLAAAEALKSAQTSPPSVLDAAITVLGGLLASITDAAVVAAVAEVLAEAVIVAAGAVAVAIAFAILQSGVCYLAVDAKAAIDFAKAKAYELLAEDPPDPNFTVIAQPVIPSLSVQPLSTATGLSSKVVSDMNSLFTNLEQEIALLRVIPITINRVSGAVAAGNAFWQRQQAQAAQSYASQLIALLKSEDSTKAALANDLAESGLVFTFSATNVGSNLNTLLQNGFPAGLTAALNQLGLDPTAQAEALQTARSASPNFVAALGDGVFPQALSDPSFLSSNKTTITAFTELAAATPATSLSPAFNVTLPGDYTVAGVGLRGGTPPSYGPPPASASISISAIPSGASVVKAFLYWGMLDDGEHDSLKNLNFNSTPVTGTRIGSGPDTCWGRLNSFTYRADVTPFVTGNGTYTLTNVAKGGSILQEGASLVVIYQLAGLPFKTIMLDDGNVSIPIGTTTATSSFSDFTAAGPVSATTTFMVGDGQLQQGARTTVSFTGSIGTLSLPNLFGAKDGPLWDSDTFDVSSVVGAGSSSDSATIKLFGDCILWSAQAFAVTTTPVTALPVTATGAVVKTSATGETAVDGRGLSPSDQPSLEERIEMIVLNRVIENRTTSAIDLTIQLVNSIPSNILPPDEAAKVIEGVKKKLIVADKIPPVVSGMPASGLTLWPPDRKFVKVATITANDALSGLTSFNVTVTSNERSNSSEPDFIITGSGLGSREIQLRADRLGTGPGRVYTVAATASDAAGNVITSVAKVTVPHNQGLNGRK